jgi:hypothetical protein
VAINTGLESVEHLVAFDELAENSLVAVKIRGCPERNGELRSTGVLAVVGDGELATFIVSHGQILVLEANAIGTNVFLSNATT